MVRLSLLLAGGVVGVLLSVTPALADATYHHMHQMASSNEEGVRWYTTHLDCKPWLDRKDGCLMNSTIFIFTPRATKGSSAGTGVDHIAFSYPDAAAKMKALEAAGVKIVTPFRRGRHAASRRASSRIPGARGSRSCRIRAIPGSTTSIWPRRIRTRR